MNEKTSKITLIGWMISIIIPAVIGTISVSQNFTKELKTFFDNHTVYFAAHNISKEPLEILPVGVRSRVAVIHILSDAFKFVLMLKVEIPQQVMLVFHAVAVILAFFNFFQILFRKPDVCAQPPAADGIRGNGRQPGEFPTAPC